MPSFPSTWHTQKSRNQFMPLLPSPFPPTLQVCILAQEEVRASYCTQIISWLKFLVAAKRGEGKKKLEKFQFQDHYYFH